MEEVHDIKTYLANSRIKENISSALDGVFQQPVLPYNPYVILLESFLQYSECYVMKKSHLQLEAKRLKKTDVTRMGSLYRAPSDAEPAVWGFRNVLQWVNTDKLKGSIKLALETIAMPPGVKYAISLTAPSCFHKSLLGKIQNGLSIHVDILCMSESSDSFVTEAAKAIKHDFLQQCRGCVPLLLQVSGSRNARFTSSNLELCLLQDILPTSTKIQVVQMFKMNSVFFRVLKTYTLYRVWKRLGKLFVSAMGTAPLINLVNGVLISSAGAEVYESILFQSALTEYGIVTTKGGSKSVPTVLSKRHPLVTKAALELRNEYLISSSNIDVFRYSQGLLWELFLPTNDNADREGILQDIFSLYRSTAAKFYNVSLQYKTLETYFSYSNEDPKDVIESMSGLLNEISKTLNDISYDSPCSSVHKWYASVLENNTYILERMLQDLAQFEHIPSILAVEKVSCRVASLFFLPHALLNLDVLSGELEKSSSSVVDNLLARIAELDVEPGFIEPTMNKHLEFGVDVAQNAERIQSAANMHTIAVLMQYQSDMYIDTTLENAINSISSDFPVNPYREFVTECLLSSYKVITGCVSESSVLSLFNNKPKLRSTDHQIFCIEDSIFGLRHSVLQTDFEGLTFILGVCKTVQNNPYITKKDGVRIMHTAFPCAEYLVCGRLRPMIYSIRCEEYYVMIKETKSADAEIALNFLVEMLFLHLVEMSKTHIVIGYSLEDDDVNILDMERVQARNAEKLELIGELRGACEERAQLTFHFFVKTEIGHYAKVVKDVKPVYADQSAELYDHYTPSSAINTNFAVFQKLYPANFFYDYAEGSSVEDLEFVLDQLNRAIVAQSEEWSVYQTIQLKYMLKEDLGFLPTAFYIGHSTCTKLRGLQELNETISDVVSVSKKTGTSIDYSFLKNMVIDLVKLSKVILCEIGAGKLLSTYVEGFLTRIYNQGEPIYDDDLQSGLKSLFIIFSSLNQYFEKEFNNSSSYKLNIFIAEAASELKNKA